MLRLLARLVSQSRITVASAMADCAPKMTACAPPTTTASSTTAARSPPTEPLIVVLGSTGTGKSDLALELASRFNGEVINADAMQLYDGLPILTNKMPVSAQRGIRHHLLGHISPLDPPWNVDVFKREASRAVADIRSRGKLPILVGGTHYYLDALLFPDVLLDTVRHEDQGNDAVPHHHYPLLDQPTDVLLAELRKCDPIMADRWHPNDRRKIQRSLEIFLSTGRPASDFYAEQEQRRSAAIQHQHHHDHHPWDKLLLWVHADREPLCRRLDRRVDAMLQAGLLDEVRQLYHLRRNAPRPYDMTKGIWQSIGYRQFEPYLDALLDTVPAPTSSLPALKTAALEGVKAATRRYASHQTRWIRWKQMRRLRHQGPDAVSSLYLVDSTEPDLFRDRVLDPAAELVSLFLRGEPRPLPTDLSPCARHVLSAAWDSPTPEVRRKRTCDVCQITLLTEEAWQRHVRGKNHRRVLRKRKMLELVPYEAPEQRPQSPSQDGSSSPEIASLF
ncbi:hypothetical protein CDD80_1862 [Ophiocordyceps camponoti-rufipedis]|uniref:tRNA dimethylallyltransferase n=1 Tax=Ophiocordyceps camponoti-rufipedis TaxID=2004952 RepID=A0A2C5Z874_9HYPO|nr:hypothetical protein CDD80_1862 [Ophiocordyceps camponoti-rufipedis]